MSVKRKISFDPATLAILKNLEWSEDGTQAKIITQLDRQDYVRVNKALEALGGSWSRSAKAHLFPEDPRPAVEGLIETGTLEITKYGYFPTPLNVVSKMVQLADINPGHQCLEPSAGDGRIVKAINELTRLPVHSCEINPAHHGNLTAISHIVGTDFLQYHPGQIYDRVVMNPPFENQQDIHHITHAYNLLKPGGRMVAIASEGTFFRSNKLAEQFMLLVLSNPENNTWKLEMGTFRESGTNVPTRMVLLNKEPIKQVMTQARLL